MAVASNTFDPKMFKLSFGVLAIGDFAKGTGIKVSQDGDDFTLEKGMDGNYERINNNNNLLTYEFTLKQTSPLNAELSLLRLADKKGNSGMLPILLKDMGPGGTTFVGGVAHIKKSPDLVVADSLQGRTWILEGPGEMFIGGNSAS